MPFTGSHVAAVLPLTRAARLVPSALVIGSMVPDLPYFLPLPVDATLTHSLVGVLSIDVVLGLLAVAVWHGLLARFLTAISPTRLRERLPPPARLRPRSVRRLAVLVLSLVLGALTHVLWDSFTHDGMWGVTHIGWLAEPHFGMAGYRWAQRVSSVVGAAAVVVWLVRWWRTRPPAATPVPEPSPAGPLLVVSAWTAIGLAAAGGVALAATGEVSPQRMVFLAVTYAGGAALLTVVVLAAAAALPRGVRSLRHPDSPSR